MNDVAPQLDAGKWTETAGLMDVSGPSVRWLFRAERNRPDLSITISEPDGQSYVLYQGVQYSPASKEAIRAMVRVGSSAVVSRPMRTRRYSAK